MRHGLLTFFLIGSCSVASAATYYVSGSGTDRASGLSQQTAFRTLQHAADLTRPGDIVYAMNGLYALPADKSGGAVLAITRSGTPDAWITYKALPGQQPQIATTGWSGISFGPRVAYIEVDGFTVTGNNDHIRPEDAIKRANVPKPVPDPAYDGNCISMDGRKGTATEKPHHIRILHNTVSKCGGGGVATIQADYVTISGNIIFDCSWYSIYGTSGISTLESWNSDQSTDYKMVVTGNLLYGNAELVWWVAQGKITDGEAIIIDTLRSPTLGAYKGRTLVANNVIHGNGSAAIEVFRSDHVDIFNNSTYGNVLNPAEAGRGELNLNEVGDVRVTNNILVSAKGQNPVAINTNQPCDCVFSTNLYFGGSIDARAPGSAGNIVGDPGFLHLDEKHPSTFNLRLAPGSPARGSGVSTPGIKVDFTGRDRPQTGWDRGAYQQ